VQGARLYLYIGVHLALILPDSPEKKNYQFAMQSLNFCFSGNKGLNIGNDSGLLLSFCNQPSCNIALYGWINPSHTMLTFFGYQNLKMDFSP